MIEILDYSSEHVFFHLFTLESDTDMPSSAKISKKIDMHLTGNEEVLISKIGKTKLLIELTTQ